MGAETGAFAGIGFDIGTLVNGGGDTAVEFKSIINGLVTLFKVGGTSGVGVIRLTGEVKKLSRKLSVSSCSSIANISTSSSSVSTVIYL